MRNILNYLNKDRCGFSGVNHVLSTIMIYLLFLLIPVTPMYGILRGLIANPIIGVISFFVICGAALLPDLDNSKSDGGSAALWDLGVIGSIISTVMITISGVMTSIFKGKKDVIPDTQHRFFWHTLLIPILIFVLVFFGMPDDKVSLSSVLSNINITNFPTTVIVGLFSVAICVYIGSHLLFKKLDKIIPINIKPDLLSILLTVGSIVICVTMSTNHELKIYCLCIALGYALHLVGDMFCDGGIPALFPLTGIFGKFFMKIKLSPVTVKTGGTIESMLKVVFAVIDIILVCLVFFPELATSVKLI